MDDEAASQQLMSEARVVHATDYEESAIPMSLDGASQGMIAKTPTSSAKRAKKPRRKQLVEPTSPRTVSNNPSLSNYTLKELKAVVGPSPSKSQASPSTILATPIEIPNTQADSQPSDTPTSAQKASSQAHAIGSSSRNKSKKGGRNKRTKADSSSGVQDEKTKQGGDSPSTVPKVHKPRRKGNPLKGGHEHVDATIEQNTIPATPAEEADEKMAPTPSHATQDRLGQKRPRKEKSPTLVDSVDLDHEKIAETPAATQDEVPRAAAGDSHDTVGNLNAASQPLIPRTLLDNLKAERSQSSPAKSASKNGRKPKTACKAPVSTATHEDVDSSLEERADAPEPYTNGQTMAVGHGVDVDAGSGQAHTREASARTTPLATRLSAKKRKSSKKGKQAAETSLLDWELPVRSLEDSPARSFSYELEATPEDTKDGGSNAGPSSPHRKRKSTIANKDSRSSIGGLRRPPKNKNKQSRADPNRNYVRDRVDDDHRSAAEVALDNAHELGQPADKRESGFFSADEKELIRRAIRDYQERNGLETGDLVDIIQWNPTRKKDTGANTTDQNEAQYKQESFALWDDIKNAGLLRPPYIVKKFVQTNYHNCHRGGWSQDEDKTLKDLVNHHPGNWKLIATQMNRRELDTYNRWKDYVRHGENRVTKRWTQDEEESFVNVLSTVCQRVEDHRAEIGKPPLDDYTPVINWHEVTREMGDTRSRLQCQSKWKLLRAREPPASLDVEIKPRKTPEPPQMEVEEPQKKRRKSRAKKDVEPAIAAAPAGPEDMLWGDKLDLVMYIMEQVHLNGCETDSQIDWQDIAEKMKQTWSVRTLQTAYKELQELVDDEEKGELKDSLQVVYARIVEDHESEFDQRYTPAQELATSPSKSGKKRKRQSIPSSAEASKRKKATRSVGKEYKSRELITDSDNAESEPES